MSKKIHIETENLKDLIVKQAIWFSPFYRKVNASLTNNVSYNGNAWVAPETARAAKIYLAPVPPDGDMEYAAQMRLGFTDVWDGLRFIERNGINARPKIEVHLVEQWLSNGRFFYAYTGEVSSSGIQTFLIFHRKG